MIEDMIPFFLMLAGMVIIVVIWAVYSIRQVFGAKDPNGYGYYGESYTASEERPSYESSAGRGGGMQG